MGGDDRLPSGEPSARLPAYTIKKSPSTFIAGEPTNQKLYEFVLRKTKTKREYFRCFGWPARMNQPIRAPKMLSFHSRLTLVLWWAKGGKK
uniref:SFRICE_030443 n=1 Tax=Spodoptera frugiperda TaxID=7108 RepID=A0A2H1WZ87_SPOFR